MWTHCEDSCYGSNWITRHYAWKEDLRNKHWSPSWFPDFLPSDLSRLWCWNMTLWEWRRWRTHEGSLSCGSRLHGAEADVYGSCRYVMLFVLSGLDPVFPNTMNFRDETARIIRCQTVLHGKLRTQIIFTFQPVTRSVCGGATCESAEWCLVFSFFIIGLWEKNLCDCGEPSRLSKGQMVGHPSYPIIASYRTNVSVEIWTNFWKLGCPFILYRHCWQVDPVKAWPWVGRSPRNAFWGVRVHQRQILGFQASHLYAGPHHQHAARPNFAFFYCSFFWFVHGWRIFFHPYAGIGRVRMSSWLLLLMNLLTAISES